MSAYSITTRGLPQGVLATMGDLLFAASEPGAWYDPSDMSTLFQDSAGTVPVTAVEQPVGRILDKSGRGNHATQATTTKRPVLSRRVNLLTKTEDASDAEWGANLFGNWSINNARSAAAAPSPRGDFTATTISFTAPQGTWCVGQRAAVSPGAYRVLLWVRLTPGAPSPGSAFMYLGVANGNSNAWVAPYSNLQNIGPQLDESWKMFTIDHTVPPSGVNQIELLINKGASADSCSVDVWGASLTLATDAHLPYQLVNTDTDYDADPAKYPAYLSFDGVDDALQTGNIDFTSTDKMTVWAGYAKINDGPTSVFLEAGSDYTGGGGIGAFSSNGYSAAFGFAHSDATGNQALNLVSAATEIGLITSRYDLQSGAQTSARKNSGAWVFASASGGGFLGNRPLYIGARAGSSYYFNGRLYGLLVRGAQSTLSQIEAAELYMKKKARIA